MWILVKKKLYYLSLKFCDVCQKADGTISNLKWFSLEFWANLGWIQQLIFFFFVKNSFTKVFWTCYNSFYSNGSWGSWVFWAVHHAKMFEVHLTELRGYVRQKKSLESLVCGPFFSCKVAKGVNLVVLDNSAGKTTTTTTSSQLQNYQN